MLYDTDQVRRYFLRFHGINRNNLHWFSKECERHFNGENHLSLYKQLKQ
jgi:transposase-like protein